jgi:Sulfotransferase family
MSFRLGFIFSLPRAGSTYVQRVLSSAERVRTIPEPWLMPALFGILGGPAPLAEFGYDHVRIGLNDTLARLPDGEEVWRASIADMTRRLYGAFADEGALFLDKTPRNAVFCQDIIEAFPDARFLFLWRNPLGVVSSINQTWGGGHWKAYFYEYDLYKGLRSLVDGYRAYADDPRVAACRYEDLVGDPAAHWPGVFAHFGVPYNQQGVETPPKILGSMGDQSGQAAYSRTSDASTEAWKHGFGNALRRRWARRYLDGIGTDALQLMGYDRAELDAGIAEPGGSWKMSDYARLPLSPAYHLIEPYVLRTKRLRSQGFFARR